MAKRGNISLETKLASALLALGLVSYDDAKAMGRSNLLSLFHFDHNKLHANGDPDRDEFYNLAPMLIAAHREKTQGDIKIIAKSKRLRTAQAALDHYMATGEKPPLLKRKAKIHQRANAWPKGRKLQGRGFERRA